MTTGLYATQRRRRRCTPSIGSGLLLASGFLGHRRRRRWVHLVHLHLFGFPRLALHTTHLGVGGCHRARLAMLKAVGIGIHDWEIMFGVLIKVFRGDSVAAGGGFTRERHVAFKDL